MKTCRHRVKRETQTPGACFASQGFALKISGCNFQKHSHRHRLPLRKGMGMHTPLVACQTPDPLPQHTPLHIASSPPFAAVQQQAIQTCTSTGHQSLPPQEKITPAQEIHPSPHVTRQRRAVPCPRPVHSTAGGGKRRISSS